MHHITQRHLKRSGFIVVSLTPYELMLAEWLKKGKLILWIAKFVSFHPPFHWLMGNCIYPTHNESWWQGLHHLVNVNQNVGLVRFRRSGTCQNTVTSLQEDWKKDSNVWAYSHFFHFRGGGRAKSEANRRFRENGRSEDTETVSSVECRSLSGASWEP